MGEAAVECSLGTGWNSPGEGWREQRPRGLDFPGGPVELNSALLVEVSGSHQFGEFAPACCWVWQNNNNKDSERLSGAE